MTPCYWCNNEIKADEETVDVYGTFGHTECMEAAEEAWRLVNTT